MARWKLMTSHYLNVTDEEWEYKETDRSTGREKRMRIPVPRLLDINDPSCWTQSENRNGKPGVVQIEVSGDIIVCHEGRGNPGDIVFIGDPTPDMMPLDDEAKDISESFAARWSYRPESAEGSFSQSLINEIEVKLSEPQKVEVAGLNELVAAIGQLISAQSAPNRRSV